MWWTFRAMNTDVSVSVPVVSERAGRHAANQVAAVFADAERRFSRFRDDSELAVLNRATAPIRVSRELAGALRAAREHVAATGGAFDPASGGALRAAGYDRSFELGLDREVAASPVPIARFDAIEIGDDDTVSRPPHVHLDLGGFVKGRTVDRAAREVPEVELIDAGGDVVVRGSWPVEIEDPFDATRTIATLRIRDRAIATSAPNRRRWRSGSSVAHHVIDPRTGAPAISDLAQVTVVAATAETADVVATAALVLGTRDGARLLREHALAGVLVSTAGELEVVGDLEVDHA